MKRMLMKNLHIKEACAKFSYLYPHIKAHHYKCYAGKCPALGLNKTLDYQKFLDREKELNKK